MHLAMHHHIRIGDHVDNRKHNNPNPFFECVIDRRFFFVMKFNLKCPYLNKKRQNFDLKCITRLVSAFGLSFYYVEAIFFYFPSFGGHVFNRLLACWLESNGSKIKRSNIIPRCAHSLLTSGKGNVEATPNDISVSGGNLVVFFYYVALLL